jgi:hypothetical protein
MADLGDLADQGQAVNGVLIEERRVGHLEAALVGHDEHPPRHKVHRRLWHDDVHASPEYAHVLPSLSSYGRRRKKRTFNRILLHVCADLGHDRSLVRKVQLVLGLPRPFRHNRPEVERRVEERNPAQNHFCMGNPSL